jgi:phenylacetate-CoA ligase
MFTIYRPELAEPAVELRDRHRSFLAGEWDARRVAEYQLSRLRATLAYVKQNSPFYRDRLASLDPAGFAAVDEQSLARIPFTTKDDLRNAQRDMLSRPLSDAWIFYETTGTTGRSTPCPRDEIDSLANNTVLTTYYEGVLRRHGGGQVIGVCGPTELHAFSDTFADVCRNLGLAVAKMWPHSPMVGFDRALDVMRSFPLTGLFCTPGMALTLAKRAVAAGLDPREDFELRVLMTTGELASPSLMANLGHIWGAQAHNALYASQESSVMGAVTGDGRVCTAPLIGLTEVIDPETGHWVRPDAAGVRQGELVVTHLYQGSKPLVRYRTGDLVRVTDPQPGDLVPAPSIAALGRVRDRLDLNGRLVTGYDLEDLLLRHLRGYLDYQVVIERADGADRLVLTLQPLSSAHAEGLAAGAARAVEECRAVLETELEVRVGELGNITSTGAMVSWKAARVVDRRAAEPDDEARVAARLAAGRS